MGELPSAPWAVLLSCLIFCACHNGPQLKARRRDPFTLQLWYVCRELDGLCRRYGCCLVYSVKTFAGQKRMRGVSTGHRNSWSMAAMTESSCRRLKRCEARSNVTESKVKLTQFAGVVTQQALPYIVLPWFYLRCKCARVPKFKVSRAADNKTPSERCSPFCSNHQRQISPRYACVTAHDEVEMCVGFDSS